MTQEEARIVALEQHLKDALDLIAMIESCIEGTSFRDRRELRHECVRVLRKFKDPRSERALRPDFEPREPSRYFLPKER